MKPIVVPQVFAVCLIIMQIGYGFLADGKPRTAVVDGANSIVSALAWLFLLGWGGFFKR